MNADLAKTLEELGGGYPELALRLKSMPEAEPSERLLKHIAAIPFRRVAFPRRVTEAAVAAAALFLAIAMTSLLSCRQTFRGNAFSGNAPMLNDGECYLLAHSGSPSAIETILSTQRADGSWGNDFLTRQNAAALQNEPRAAINYRRALRYLRSRGLSPLTASEMKAFSSRAGVFAMRKPKA